MKTRFVQTVGLVAIVLLLALSRASAATVVLNFDDLPAMYFGAGTPIPAYAELSTLYRHTFGVTFASGSPYVAVVDLGFGHATSGTNGIGGSTPGGILTYSRTYPITATFFDPSNPGNRPATTDFVSLRGDLVGFPAQSVTLNAYGINGHLIATTTAVDVGGETLAISAPGIHSVEFLGTFDFSDTYAGVAIDDFMFDSVTPVGERETPLPAALPLFATGLAGLGLLGWRRKKKAVAA
jgi:hypothetical protein